MTIDPENVGIRLRQSMQMAGYKSASDLARRLGVKPQAVSAWFRGEAIPSRNNLFRLETLMKVSVDYLLFGESSIIPDTTGDEKELLGLFSKLTSRQKAQALESLRAQVAENLEIYQTICAINPCPQKPI